MTSPIAHPPKPTVLRRVKNFTWTAKWYVKWLRDDALRVVRNTLREAADFVDPDKHRKPAVEVIADLEKQARPDISEEEARITAEEIVASVNAGPATSQGIDEMRARIDERLAALKSQEGTSPADSSFGRDYEKFPLSVDDEMIVPFDTGKMTGPGENR